MLKMCAVQKIKGINPECACKQCVKQRWYIANRQVILKTCKEKGQSNRVEYKKNYALANRSKINAHRREWHNLHKNDPLFKLKINLRSRLNKAFKGKSKAQPTMTLLGCSIEHAFAHISNLFEPGMTWQNYGQWHVDHKYPLSLAKNEEELIKLCHISNLQPLWGTDNIKKGNKVNTANLNGRDFPSEVI